MRDKRQINRIWEHTNRLGEIFTFAHVGTGKNKVLVTLHNGAMLDSDQNSIGNTYFNRNH